MMRPIIAALAFLWPGAAAFAPAPGCALRAAAAITRTAPARAAATPPPSARRRLVTTGLLAAALLPCERALAETAGPMSGKTVVVTGANSGLGLAAARQVAETGASVVLAVRDKARGEEAKRAVLASAAGADVRVEILDLGDLKSVRTFAKRLADTPIDCLMCNAGVMAIPERSTTADGFERQFGVNHLGHFALAALLWPNLRKAAQKGGSRVVVVASDAHRRGTLDFADIQRAAPGAYKDCSTPLCPAYATSKLANVVFAQELARRVPPGLDVAVSSVTPGLVNTALMRYALPDLKTDVGSGDVPDRSKLATLFDVQKFFMKDPDAASQAQVRLASDPALNRASAGGKYFGADGKAVPPSAAALDPDAGAKLWDLSEELTGIKFDPAA